jgi:hypothetical protein
MATKIVRQTGAARVSNVGQVTCGPRSNLVDEEAYPIDKAHGHKERQMKGFRS